MDYRNPANLKYAAGYGRFEDVKHICEKEGADVSADNEQALSYAIKGGFLDIAEYLIDQGCTGNFLTEDHKKKFTELKNWKKIAGISPPNSCSSFSPHFFSEKETQNCFRTLAARLKQEHPDFVEGLIAQKAFHVAALFKSTDMFKRYFEKWAKNTQSPLNDVMMDIETPDTYHSDIDFTAWSEACIQHGPKLAHLFKFADKIPHPVKSETGAGYDYSATLKEAAKHAYAGKGAENPELALVFMDYLFMTEDDFEVALSLSEEFNKKYPAGCKAGSIPDICFTLPNGMTYRKLKDGDYKSFILGECTNNAQITQDVEAKKLRHGYLSPNGGFYVVEDEVGKIIGQSWAWLGENNELVLDSLETAREFDESKKTSKKITPEQWQYILDVFALEVTQYRDIRSVYASMGGGTSRHLKYEQVHGVTPKDFDRFSNTKKGLYFIPSNLKL